MALWRRRLDWLFPAAMILVPAVVMAPFQPVPRYTYLIYPTFVFSAGGLFFARRRVTVSPTGPSVSAAS